MTFRTLFKFLVGRSISRNIRQIDHRVASKRVINVQMNQTSWRVKRKSDGEIKRTVDRIENRPGSRRRPISRKGISTERISFHVSFSVFGSPINYSSANQNSRSSGSKLFASPPYPLVFSSPLLAWLRIIRLKKSPAVESFLRAIISQKMDLAASNLPIKRDFHHFYIIFLIFDYIFPLRDNDKKSRYRRANSNRDNNKYFTRWIKSKKISFSYFFSSLNKRSSYMAVISSVFFRNVADIATASSPCCKIVQRLFAGTCARIIEEALCKLSSKTITNRTIEPRYHSQGEEIFHHASTYKRVYVTVFNFIHRSIPSHISDLRFPSLSSSNVFITYALVRGLRFFITKLQIGKGCFYDSNNCK